jgi:A/G-specific adenine glycosylase
VELVRVLCLRADSILLYRSPDSARRLAGQYEFPKAAQVHWEPAGKPLVCKTRSITHYRIRERIYRLPEMDMPGDALESGLMWVRLCDLDSLTLSGPHRRWLGELLKRFS